MECVLLLKTKGDYSFIKMIILYVSVPKSGELVKNNFFVNNLK